jgi:hypothetical protein
MAALRIRCRVVGKNLALVPALKKKYLGIYTIKKTASAPIIAVLTIQLFRLQKRGTSHFAYGHFAYVAFCLQKIGRQTDTIFQTFVSSGILPTEIGWMQQNSVSNCLFQ